MITSVSYFKTKQEALASTGYTSPHISYIEEQFPIERGMLYANIGDGKPIQFVQLGDGSVIIAEAANFSL